MATGRRDAGMRGSRRSRCPHPSPALDKHTGNTQRNSDRLRNTALHGCVYVCV